MSTVKDRKRARKAGTFTVAWQNSPFIFAEPGRRLFPHGVSLADMVAAMDGLPKQFHERGVICINNEEVPRALWSQIKPKASTAATTVCVTLHMPLAGGRGGGGSGKQIGMIVAALALTLLTAGISAGLLGPAVAGSAVAGALSVSSTYFAAGSLSAMLLSGAVGIIGSLAIAALTPPPSTQSKKSNNDDNTESASAEGNVLVPNGAIPAVVGTRKVYPPLAQEPITELVGQDEFVDAAYVLNGPHQLTDLRIGNTAIDDADDVEYEVIEGWLDDYPTKRLTRQGRTNASQVEISSHKVDRDNNSSLEESDKVDDVLPKWHSFATRKSPDEFWAHLAFAEGLWDRANDAWQIAVPFRIRFRKKGETEWNNCPEIHYTANRASLIRAGVLFKWGDPPGPTPGMVTKNGWWFACKNVPVQGVAPPEGEWVAHSHFSSGSGDDYLYSGIESASNIQNLHIGKRTPARERSADSGDPGDRSNIATFYLDETTFPKGIYEVEFKRGIAYRQKDFTKTNYKYLSAVYNLFGYRALGVTKVVAQSPEGIAHRVYIMRTVSIWNEHPLPLPGLAQIIIKAKNRTIDKVSAMASRYVKDWDGDGWNTWTTTSNPAPHFRDMLCGPLNLDPLPEEIIDDDTLVEWRQRCIDDGRTCDAIFQGQSLEDSLNIVAACGYARPYQSEVWSVIQDYDRSEEGPVQRFSARNTRGMSFRKAMPRMPDGLRVTYRLDEGDYDSEQISVFLEGETGAENSRMEQTSYEGLVEEAKIIERARFDLKQAKYRGTFYSFDAPVESIICRRGSLIEVEHDILSRTTSSARIRRRIFSGGDITALDMDSSVYIVNEPDMHEQPDIRAVTNMHEIGMKSSMFLRHSDGTMETYPIANATGWAKRVTLVAPLEDAEWDGGPYDRDPIALVEPGALAMFGHHENEILRLIVSNIEPGPDLTASLTCLDEAPELWS